VKIEKISEITGVLPKKYIKEMTEKARSKAKKRVILSHLISVYILALINEARKGGKTRFSCVFSSEKLAEIFKNHFPSLRIRKKIKQDLHQCEVYNLIERLGQDYVPTEKRFNLMVKTFNGMTESDILYLETKNVTIFGVNVIDTVTNKLLRTEDVKMGDTMPMLRTFFRLRRGKLEWIIPKNQKEVKLHG